MAFFVRWQVQSQLLFAFTDYLYVAVLCGFYWFFFFLEIHPDDPTRWFVCFEMFVCLFFSSVLIDFCWNCQRDHPYTLFTWQKYMSGWSCNVITNTRSTIFSFFCCLLFQMSMRKTISKISNRFYYYSKRLNDRFWNQEMFSAMYSFLAISNICEKPFETNNIFFLIKKNFNTKLNEANGKKCLNSAHINVNRFVTARTSLVKIGRHAYLRIKFKCHWCIGLFVCVRCCFCWCEWTANCVNIEN